jgi:GntR family transcriptional regulator/MocR family aminotransferase
MELFLDPRQRRGLANALYVQLRDAIVTGRLRDGDRLPPSRDLAQELGVSRHTVTTVYGRLVAEGFLEGRSGGGTHVSYSAGAVPGGERPTPLRPRPVPAIDFVTPPPPDGGIDLRIGLPDRRLFPLTAWRRCVVSALQAAPSVLVGPTGDAELRRAIAHWVGRSRGVEADEANIVVTDGAQHAVDLCARVLLEPGDRVAFEEPGYAPVRHLLQTSGFEVVPVPVDDDGIIVDAIPADVRMVYVTPSHQSPTGATMSLARRQLHRLDGGRRVLYVGTFAKTLSPALRLGFVALPHSLTPAVVKLAELTGTYPPAADQRALYHFIVEGHLDRHLRKARRVYGERHQLVTSFVREAVADGLLRPGPTNQAGLHLAARLPAGISEREVIDRARRENVALTSLSNAWTSAPRWEALLLGFGRAEPPQLARGLAVVRNALQRRAA